MELHHFDAWMLFLTIRHGQQLYRLFEFKHLVAYDLDNMWLLLIRVKMLAIFTFII
jgi:hypothetical protein